MEHCPCSQLSGPFPSAAISSLGQPTTWRPEGGHCSPKPRHFPLLTHFSSPGDRERPLCPTFQFWLPLPAWAQLPTGLGELCSSETRALQGQGEAPQRWLGQDQLCMCMGEGWSSQASDWVTPARWLWGSCSSPCRGCDVLGLQE